MINQDKIIDFLHNTLKCSLYEVDDRDNIKVKSNITHLEKLIEFVTPLNYRVSYICGMIYIIPK